MALTRPRFGQLNTSVVAEADPITVLNQGSSSANVDVGFLFNRANGLVSNVALYWSESAQSIVTAYTANTGATNSNITVSSYANLTVGNVLLVTGSILNVQGNINANILGTHYGNIVSTTANIAGDTYVGGNLTVAGNIIAQNREIVTSVEIVSGNLVANSGTASTSTTTGALVVVGGAGISGAVVAGAGTVSNPAVAIGSSNRGFYNPTAGDVGFVSGGWEQVRYVYTGPTNDYITFTGAGTGNAAVIGTAGADAAVTLLLQPKGAASNLAVVANGAVVLSSGTGAISVIRYNALGSGYSTQPTITISAPTTAGGVTATANASIFFGGGTVVSGGTGYSVGDVLAVVGGSYTSQGYLTVTGNSSGVITSVTTTNGGAYYSFPANAVSVTGGTGSGATFNLIPGGVNSYNLLSGGSGYVEPPTITVTGGGGSGATAIARIGNIPAIRSLASSLDFYTSNGQVLRLTDSTNLAVNYWQIGSAASGVQVSLSAVGGDAAIGTNFTTKGAGSHVFSTNSFGSAGLVVTHTASAVNYPQITGATTGNGPVLFVQGSDSNIELNLQSKGTSGINLRTGASTATQFRVGDTPSAVNYIQVTGSTTGTPPIISSQGSDSSLGMKVQWKGAGNFFLQSGSGSYNQLKINGANAAVNNLVITGTTAGNAPSLSVEGSDTNIDINLTPKGTGNVTTANPLTVTNANVSTGTGTGALIVAGGAGIAGNLSIGANLYVNTITTTAGSNGNLTIDPDGVGDLIISPATEMFIQSTLASTNTGSGALVVAGGVGVAGNINASGNIYAIGTNSKHGYTWANSVSSVYTVFNSSTNSIDTVFG